jgi:hypothetical protein
MAVLCHLLQLLQFLRTCGIDVPSDYADMKLMVLFAPQHGVHPIVFVVQQNIQ